MAVEIEAVTEKIDKISIVENGNDDQEKYWGFSLFEAFKMAIKFYKENEGKRTFALEYDDKVYLSALTKQVSHGPMKDQSELPEIGYLDMFGHDKRRVWESLGDTSSNDARRKFIDKIQTNVPVFAPFMIAHQKEREMQELKRKQDEERERKAEEERQMREAEERERKKEIAQQIEEDQRLKDEQKQQKQQIMTALNAQTQAQFQQYAAQQYPGNPEQQAVLINHLQEQHYQQYMNLYLQQQQVQVQTTEVSNTEVKNEESDSTESGCSEASVARIADPSLWTRPQLEEFKTQIKRDPESVINVGRGEVVTVRVPTHEEGAYVFWEFASDNYDLGFGVHFEWSEPSSDQRVSVQIGESSAEDSDEEGGDLERGSGMDDRPPVDEIVPVYRRECHSEVHAGSHRYPGRGVYLLKFDNSYSLWRSKTLYYRVYYTR